MLWDSKARRKGVRSCTHKTNNVACEATNKMIERYNRRSHKCWTNIYHSSQLKLWWGNNHYHNNKGSWDSNITPWKHQHIRKNHEEKSWTGPTKSGHYLVCTNWDDRRFDQSTTYLVQGDQNWYTRGEKSTYNHTTWWDPEKLYTTCHTARWENDNLEDQMKYWRRWWNKIQTKTT